MGRDLLSQSDPPPTDAAMDDLLDEAIAVLSRPDLDFLFAPETLAEVAVTADLGGRRMLGAIDRLVIAPDHVLAIDFKSNAIVPASPGEVPDGILLQMGAYAQALCQIYPGRRIETAILWTRTGALMPLPPQIMEAAMRAATMA
jgi:ATP-dependent helicase/nuclease subunit A